MASKLLRKFDRQIEPAWRRLARREAQKAQKRIEKDRREGVFRPDGIVEDAPYRELPNGEIEVLMDGGIARFRNFDHLRSMMNAASAHRMH